MQTKQTEKLNQSQPEQSPQNTIDFLNAEGNPPINPEQPTASNQEKETLSEAVREKQSIPQEENSVDKTIDSLKKTLRLSKKKQKNSIPQIRDQVTLEIEQVLEEGLGDAFRALTPVQQQEFKIKGEQVAFDIRNMFMKPRLKVRALFKLILDWLKLLPGINRFFLQQEAKIKVDKLVSMHKHKHHK